MVLGMSDDPTNFLPPGRYRWTWEDVEAKFVPETQFGETRRQIVWQHFKFATETLRDVVPIAAVWIGGSFLSSKPEPGDVDAVYIVRGKEYDALQDVADKQLVALFSGGEQLKQRGLLVDSYVLHWTPRVSNGLETDREHRELTFRGYWDDWLQRNKLDRKAPPAAADAEPVRGYVEVVLDGFVA